VRHLLLTHLNLRNGSKSMLQITSGEVLCSGIGHRAQARSFVDLALKISGCTLMNSSVESNFNDTVIRYTIEGTVEQLDSFVAVATP
jgi:hypothetical protein